MNTLVFPAVQRTRARAPFARFLIVAGLLLAAGAGCGRKTEAPDAVDPEVVAAVNRGVSLMGQYDYDGAVNAFAAALASGGGSTRRSPEATAVELNLAIARFNRGRKESADIEESLRLIDGILARDPAHVRALYFKGIVLQHQGQAEPAIACFDQVVKARPGDGVAWYLLGLCRQRMGQDATRELRRAIELRPYLVSAYYRLWQILQAAGQPDQAGPYLERFKQLRESPLAEIIELPQYNQMGELALVVPLGERALPAGAAFTYRAGTLKPLVSEPARGGAADHVFGGAAVLDLDRDGHAGLLLGDTGGRTFALRGAAVHGWPAPTPIPGLEAVEAPRNWAVGDYDNDEIPDVFLVSAPNPSQGGPRGGQLFRGQAGGRFERVAGPWEEAAAPASALWFDADHDGDLDLLLCGGRSPNLLFNNNSDGTFTAIGAGTALTASEHAAVMALPGDLDGDTDMDLVLLRADAPAVVVLNELAGTFAVVGDRRPAPVPDHARPAAPLVGSELHGDRGGVLQDFNGDGFLDLLALGGEPAALQLQLGNGQARFERSEPFARTVQGLPDADSLRGFRVVDLDLDGDLDVAVFGREGHVLLNDGTGRFVGQARIWTASPGAAITGAEVLDLTGDLVPDLLLVERGTVTQVLIAPGVLSPRGSALAVAPTGVRSRDKRTRSPASGYGVNVVVRAGLREQTRWITGQNGGWNQSPVPVVFGLGGAPQADYVRLNWPDGVAQVETALAAGQVHVVAETQRKVSSCPVLFTWNGSRFEFITDFAGVGGLGYFVGPGEYAQPQAVDHVKIEPGQLREREGVFEVRITEPMEETAYVDRLELVAIDHPSTSLVYPDERLTITGPAPTRDLLVVERPVFPERAFRVDAGGPAEDCAPALRQADRHYAYEPELDRRFCGFCRPHTLELDFGHAFAGVGPAERLFLFINGYLEYPYSQTTYAAAQARTGWQPLHIERQQTDGTWATLVPDAGALGGMARTMTVDLTGLAAGGPCRLRITSNLEIYYDRIFAGVVGVAEPGSVERSHPAGPGVRVHPLPVKDAELRYAGFAREVSPDGRQPLIYDYQQTDLTAPFRVLSGAYTRYGPVRELLEAFDDDFVLVGSGDEIAATFDATGLPPLPEAWVRSFVLVSHAYCKDMDRYTATPDTLEPLPFRGMTRYPYPATERYPDTPRHRELQSRYNTRIVE